MFLRTCRLFLFLTALAIFFLPARAFGQDLFVTSIGTDEIKRYDGVTGVFLDTFVSAGSGGLGGPTGITFGPNGSLYVTGNTNGAVKHYDGTTGAFLGDVGSGLSNPGQLKFGPDGNLYISNRSSIARFDGTTGISLGAISGGGMNLVLGLTFAPNGDLLAASQNPGTIKRYNPTTGVYLGDLVLVHLGGSSPLIVSYS